ncbi:MAG TPA: alpha/beta fold hydrolase [Myxococcales bacterium]|nr:alpha/beta fold hydrolase [Myxococcales bacterium]HIL00522.1 alpha/beta fold hydrolase [Myxococcales bacterium]
MPRATRDAIEFEYDVFGAETGKPLLLIMGLGAQMVLWDEGFCEKLAAEGHRVIRFDNRDIGLSTWLDDLGIPDMAELVAAGARGEPMQVPYSLDDMADDAVAVIDALGIDAAHICGASMGGMIAQALAIRHPARVRSLTSIMSTTGNPDLPPASPEAMAVLTEPMPDDRAAVVERSIKSDAIIGSPGYPGEPDVLRERAGMLFDRSFHPVGSARQMAAIMAHGDRRPALQELDVPALVIHGQADALVPVEGGIDTHEAIAGSELMLIDGMGHNLPPQLWDSIVARISALTARVDGKN